MFGREEDRILNEMVQVALKLSKEKSFEIMEFVDSDWFVTSAPRMLYLVNNLPESKARNRVRGVINIEDGELGMKGFRYVRNILLAKFKSAK